ncbi:DUF4231 domain-containing protein [Nocardia crassostreae]|uniref:DUF4231 domain-containing protein n=1 Tax=Nocardia crassostreae TaxID=53428 RepID=UPI001471387F|nr:DUF4231 domain-containing protein [Nocardia crassostreae]
MNPERAGYPDENDPIWARLLEQITWYSTKSLAAQHLYKRTKIGQIAVGAIVPVAALSAPPVLTAGLAAIVVIAEGVQQLFQWHTDWLLYRSTAEALKTEKARYLAGGDPYSTADRRAVLAERIEHIVSSENLRWIAEHQPSRPGTEIPAPQQSRTIE